MSDEHDRDDEDLPRDDEDLPEGEDAGAVGDEDDAKGLGLTEEFARLESDMKSEGRKDVRFDETDSSEWVAPVSPPEGASRETDEWAAAGAFEGVDAEEPEVQAEAADPGEAAGTDAEDATAADADEADPGGDAPSQPAEIPEQPEEPVPDPSEDDAPATPPPDSDEATHGGVPDAPTVPPPPATLPAPPPSTSAADAPATEHTVVRDRPLAPVPIAAGGYRLPPVADEDIADRTPALWWRFLTGSVMIIASVATAVALSSLLAINGIAQDLQPIPGVEPFITTIEPGEPQTILVVGSDKRSNTPGDPGRSDTTMLLRVDADNQVLSLFSLPRDLKVDIAGNNYGEDKLNAAFTIGGIKKTLATVKNLTGLEINHVVNVDFQGFADAVDAIDCVYVDVDRDYFNDNSQAFSDAEAYAAIDVNAGYQRLCGLNALDYVRYRHTDSDFARAARQQDFLRNARAQVPVSKVLPIIGDGDTSSELLDIFTKYTSSDIRTPGDIIGVLKAFIGIRDVPIREVHFNGSDTIENGISYVTATPEQIKKAVDQFLGEEDTTGGPDAGPAPDKSEKPKKDKRKAGGGSSDSSSNANVVSAADASATCVGTDKFEAFGRTSARRLKFPVFVPTAVVPGSCYDDGSRQYDIKDLDDNKQPAYKMVIALNNPDVLNEFYGVQGTTWQDPPILEKKSETRTIDDRDYDLYYDGDRLRLVAFHDEEGNSYWVSNTLLQTLSEDDMIAIATSMQEAHGG